MSDTSILHHVAELVEEEQRIRAHATTTAADSERLRHLGEQLDQCWDLLRQRRAKREFGEDPASARVRDIDTVRQYEG